MGVRVLFLLSPLALLALLLAMEQVERSLREDRLPDDPAGTHPAEVEPLVGDGPPRSTAPGRPGRRRRLARLIPGLSR